MTDQLAGTKALARFAVRHDRVRMAVWTVSLLLLVWSTAASVESLFPTQEDLDQVAATTRDNPALLAMSGPDQALDTVGGQVAYQVGAFGLVVMALMSLFLVGRLTRAEEEGGRTELIRSMAVGRYAPLAAALLVVAALDVLLGTLLALALLTVGLPVAGSLAFGASYVLLGWVFAAVTAVTAQVTENTRVAYGLAGAVIGYSYVMRAAGDAGDGTLSWLSPIGWAQKMRPYAGERWWPLLVSLVFAVALVAVASRLTARRDLGAGLVPPQPGPPEAAPGLAGPLGLAARLQRGSVVAWSAGVLLLGVVYGSIADAVDEFVADNETTAEILAQGGGDIVDSYLSTSMLVTALVGAGFAVQSVLRLRSEESALRAEPLLATRVSRGEWVASHVTVAAVGSLVVLLAGGLGLGLTHAVVSGDAGQVPRLVGAALAYAPAMWVLAGLALALFGLVPRATLLAWAAVVFCFVVGMFTDLFDLPQWVNDLSPFQHVPQLPAAEATVTPLVALVAVAAALATAGLAGFRHRDVG